MDFGNFRLQLSQPFVRLRGVGIAPFRERAFTLFGRGTRVGDMRRLIRQYNRTEDNVFPTGKFHKAGGASYGTDVNLPVTDNERQNPNFAGCLDRKSVV